MYKINFYFKKFSFLSPILFVNEKEILLKKKKGKITGHCFCENNATIKIINYHPLNQNFGLLICYFFFLISILGIFDKRYKSKTKSLLFEADLVVKEDSDILFEFNKFSLENAALKINSNQNLLIKENKYFYNNILKKKLKYLNLLKSITWLCSIVIIFLILYFLFY